jgi:hypothetical protein
MEDALLKRVDARLLQKEEWAETGGGTGEGEKRRPSNATVKTEPPQKKRRESPGKNSGISEKLTPKTEKRLAPSRTEPRNSTPIKREHRKKFSGAGKTTEETLEPMITGTAEQFKGRKIEGAFRNGGEVDQRENKGSISSSGANIHLLHSLSSSSPDLVPPSTLPLSLTNSLPINLPYTLPSTPLPSTSPPPTSSPSSGQRSPPSRTRKASPSSGGGKDEGSRKGERSKSEDGSSTLAEKKRRGREELSRGKEEDSRGESSTGTDEGRRKHNSASKEEKEGGKSRSGVPSLSPPPKKNKRRESKDDEQSEGHEGREGEGEVKKTEQKEKKAVVRRKEAGTRAQMVRERRGTVDGGPVVFASKSASPPGLPKNTKSSSTLIKLNSSSGI